MIFYMNRQERLERKAKALELASETDWTQKQISGIVNLSVNTVGKVCRTVRSPRTTRTPEIIRRLKENESVTYIARELGISRQIIYVVKQRHNL